MTTEELRELDRLLAKFGAVILDRPFRSQQEDRKHNALFHRVTAIRKAVKEEAVKS